MATVVFDLDGTLADTSGDLIAAANAVFVSRGHRALLDPERDKLTAFHGGRAMLKLGYSRLDGSYGEADVDAGYPDLLGHYEQAIDVHTQLYPGAISAVEVLLARGYKTAVCTNKPESLAETLLSRLGVRQHFGSLIGADTLAVRKPHPAPFVEAVRLAGGDPSRAILIGDTHTDRETARAAEVPCVLVTFGPEGEAVMRLEPEATLAHFDDLPMLAERLLPIA